MLALRSGSMQFYLCLEPPLAWVRVLETAHGPMLRTNAPLSSKNHIWSLPVLPTSPVFFR
ncbi:MAG: hypothetical protein AAF627_21585 [Myxococcota bacterium]